MSTESLTNKLIDIIRNKNFDDVYMLINSYGIVKLTNVSNRILILLIKSLIFNYRFDIIKYLKSHNFILASMEKCKNSGFFNPKTGYNIPMILATMINKYPSVFHSLKIMIKSMKREELQYSVGCFNLMIILLFNCTDKQQLKIIKILIDKKISLYVETYYYKCPVFFKVFQHKLNTAVEILKIFIKSGVDINMVDSNGRNLLNYLCYNLDEDSVHTNESTKNLILLLIRSKIDVNNQCDEYKRTPLMNILCKRKVKYDILNIISNCSDLSIRNMDNKSSQDLLNEYYNII